MARKQILIFFQSLLSFYNVAYLASVIVLL